MKTWLATLVGMLVLAGSAMTANPPPRSDARARQPLTYANVVSFLKETKLHPIKVQERCTVFFEGEFQSRDVYAYCLIIVENSDEDLQVTFYLTDAHEMNWVTEFLDAPFFSQAETQRLFQLMHSGREARGQRVGGFRVDFHRWEPRHAQILVFSFSRS